MLTIDENGKQYLTISVESWSLYDVFVPVVQSKWAEDNMTVSKFPSLLFEKNDSLLNSSLVKEGNRLSAINDNFLWNTDPDNDVFQKYGDITIEKQDNNLDTAYIKFEIEDYTTPIRVLRWFNTGTTFTNISKQKTVFGYTLFSLDTDNLEKISDIKNAVENGNATVNSLSATSYDTTSANYLSGVNFSGDSSVKSLISNVNARINENGDITARYYLSYDESNNYPFNITSPVTKDVSEKTWESWILYPNDDTFLTISANDSFEYYDVKTDTAGAYFEITYEDDMDLVFSKYVYCHYKTANDVEFLGVFTPCITTLGLENLKLTNGNVTVETDTTRLSSTSKLAVEVNTESLIKEYYFSSVYDTSKTQLYTISFTDAKGNPIKSNGDVKLTINLPDDFSFDTYYTAIIYENGGTPFSRDNLSVSEIEKQYNLADKTWTVNRIVDGLTFAVVKLNQNDDVTKLLPENGETDIYKTNINFIKTGTNGTTSMSNAALDHDAYLVIKNNNGIIERRLYFNMVEMSVGTTGGLYIGDVYCIGSGKENRKYLKFVSDENGNLPGNCGYDAYTEWACLERAVITLTDDGYLADKNSYVLAIAAPAMAALGGSTYEEVMDNMLSVELVFSDVVLQSNMKEIDVKALFPYDKSALLRAIKRAQSAKLYDPDLYTTESYNNLMSACDLAQTVYEATFSDTVTASNAYEEQINLVQAAIDALVLDESAIGDKTELEALVAKAKAITADEYTNSSYAALTEAIGSAEKVLAKDAVKQSRLDEQVKALQSAIDALEKKPETALDKDNLADGKYTLTAEMIKTDRKSKSMSNNAINHTVQLEVVDGEYFVTMQFKGLAIYNQFGYLKDLGYYDAGYTYNDYGIPQGTVLPAEVLSTYDTVDQYNDADNLYPQLLKFKLVDKASADFVPLQVFVPIMEAIAEGTGTQDVLMQLDWSTLVRTDEDIVPEEQEEQSPAVDAEDKATGVKVHADKGVFEEGVQLVVTPVTSGSDFDNAKKALDGTAKAFSLYEIHFIDKNGSTVQPNGTVSVSIPVPSDYSDKLAVYRINDNAGKTLMSGEAKDGFYTYLTKSFSLYALADTNVTAGSTPAENKPADNGNSGNPQTGAAAMGFAGIALAGAALILARRKEK